MTPVAVVYGEFLNRFRHACRDRDDDRAKRLFDAANILAEEFPTEVAEYEALFSSNDRG